MDLALEGDSSSSSSWIATALIVIAGAVVLYRRQQQGQQRETASRMPSSLSVDEMRKKRLEKSASQQETPSTASSSLPTKRKSSDAAPEPSVPVAAASVPAGSASSVTRSTSATSTATTTVSVSKAPEAASVSETAAITPTAAPARKASPKASPSKRVAGPSTKSPPASASILEAPPKSKKITPKKFAEAFQKILDVDCESMVPEGATSADMPAAVEALFAKGRAPFFFQQAIAKDTIRQLLQRHERLMTTLKSSAATEELKACLRTLQGALWSAMGRDRLGPEVTDGSQTQAEDDVPDLFRDDLMDSAPSHEEVVLGPHTTEWLMLLEDMNPSLTPTLIEGVLSTTSDPKATVTFWMHSLCLRLSALYASSSMDTNLVSITLPRRWNAFLHLWKQSPLLRQAYAVRLKETADMGRLLEANVPWAELCRASAFALPTTVLSEGPSSLFGRTMIQTVAPNDPSQVARLFFARDSYRAVEDTLKTSRQWMNTARVVGESFYRLWMKTLDDKSVVFDWFRNVVTTNDSVTEMLQADLLSSEGIVQLTSSWRFLCGLSTTVVGICSEMMGKKLSKSGAQAFDSGYLEHYDMIDDRYRLVSRDQAPETSSTSKVKEDVRFDGATEFFFLGAALLHVSIYPLMRVEDAFHQQYQSLMMMLQSLDKRKIPVPQHLVEQSQTAVVAWLSYDAFFDDPDLLSKLVPFALTQLQWVRTVALQKDSQAARQALVALPDWFCKEPARWLAHVARKVPRSLKSHQADLAVDVTTQLLTAGSNERSSGFSFSPLVLTELIRVASAFVGAGARRAQRKQQLRRHRGFGMQQDSMDDEDEDDEDIMGTMYTSLDKDDLGVAVFANRRVCEELCPALIQTFRALDHIEGLNVDAEASFDKFSVKMEIARLLIQLWGHPSGECRRSIVNLPASEISQFAKSVAAAIGYLLDDACQRYTDVVKLSRRHPSTLPPRDRMFLERQTRSAVSCFLCGRTFLLLLFRLSEVESIAQAIGGGSTAQDMATMLVHFFDVLTGPDGGTHPDLDVLQRRTSIMVQSIPNAEKSAVASKVAAARRHARATIGVDVSELAHVLMALSSRWYSASMKLGTGSSFVSALASLDDCDVQKYRSIVDRLIPDKDASLVKDPAVSVFHRDGYVDGTVFPSKTNADELSEMQRNLMRTARQCHMSHDDISALATRSDVLSFLERLSAERDKVVLEEERQLEKAAGALERVMGVDALSDEDAYGEALKEWTMSSEPFASTTDSSLLHYFGKTAQGRGALGSGKALQREARKSFRTIPVPHPNSSVFVCYSEERVDLARAIVTGPVDTPYANGCFVFDVYFPPSYPHIPPLVQFMTTGGGQVRFGPNLYQDGKVCLSLLGTFNAQDESQQWNPKISSLAQVLLSIQTQLLVKDPYFLEPGLEAVAETQQGMETSRRYNMRRRLDTLRHAILEPLLDPPLGFKEVLIKHFSMCSQRIVAQARRWTLEARGTQLEARFEKVYGQILVGLQNLLDSNSENLPPLEPLKEDADFLASHDPSFSGSDRDDRKPAALPSVSAPSQATSPWGATTASPMNPWSAAAAANPWSAAVAAPNPWAAGTQAAPSHPQSMDDDDDDDFYS